MHRYVFRSTWQLASTPAEVYAALADVERYPDWWPQVRGGHRIDESSGRIVCRSVLPYDLSFVVTREVEDPALGVLRARLEGDLVGTSEWTVRASGSGSSAIFDEDVTVGSRLLRAAGFAARPMLVANHNAMMRAGERGLRKYLGTPARP